MPHNKVCEYCEVVFSARRSDARFCGQRCSKRALKGTPQKVLCGDCFVDITHRHGNAKYCAPCYEKREAEHSFRDMVCPECDAEFRARLPQVYCSARCGGKASRKAQLSKVREVECLACGQAFETRDSRPIACSVACKQWAKKYPGVKRKAERPCKECGEIFSDTRMYRSYCSARCARRAMRVKRRGRLAATYVEDVSVSQLLERDGSNCMICYTPLDLDAKWPDRLSVTVDHAIPISLGGEHSLGNTQLAHAVCNSAKGNRLVFISEVMPICQIQRRETSLPHT